MTKLPPGRELPPQTISIKSTVTKVNLQTGEEVTEPTMWHMFPPPARKCQVCAAEHDPLVPHNAQSLFYQMAFKARTGRNVTWADAVAHCESGLALRWEQELRKAGHWTGPPEGVAPIRHLGPEAA